MLTLTALRTDQTATFTTSKGRSPAARQAIVVGFHPWIGQHLRTHGVPLGDRNDQVATLIAAFTEGTVELSTDAPYLWPATTIIHAKAPIGRYYRHLYRAVNPIGQATELEHVTGIELIGHNRFEATGPELVLALLVAGIHAARFTLEDASVVARIVIDGESA